MKLPYGFFKPFLCDGCDNVRRFVWSSDGRTLVCAWCRIRFCKAK